MKTREISSSEAAAKSKAGIQISPISLSATPIISGISPKMFDFNLNGFKTTSSSSSKKKTLVAISKLVSPINRSPTLRTPSTISNLKDHVSSRFDSIKRNLDPSHSEILKEFEAYHSRLSKRFKQQGTIIKCSEFPFLGEHSLHTTTTNCSTPCNKGLEEQTQIVYFNGLNIQNLPRRSPIHHMKSIPKVMETQPLDYNVCDKFPRFFRNERKNLLRSIAPSIVEIPPVVGGIDSFLKSSILSGVQSAGLMDLGIRRKFGFFSQKQLGIYKRTWPNMVGDITAGTRNVASGSSGPSSSNSAPPFAGLVVFGSFQGLDLSKSKTPAGPDKGKQPLVISSPPPEPSLTEAQLRDFSYTFVLQDGRGVRHLNNLPCLKEITNEVKPHGLWPKVYGKENFLQKEFQEDLMPADMELYWPNALVNGRYDQSANKRFWKRQWDGHGRYGLKNQKDYMEFVIRLQKFFGPIVDFYLRECTIIRETRKYLNVELFICRLKEGAGIYVTVHGFKKDFMFRKQNMTLQFLGEIRVYLNGENPLQTITPPRPPVKPYYDQDLEMNIY